MKPADRLVTPSAASVDFVGSVLRDLPSSDAILAGHRVADLDDRGLLIQWQITRTWIRDGIVRLVGVESGAAWEEVAWQADKVFRDRLATPDAYANLLAFAQLLDQTGAHSAIKALLLLRQLFGDLSAAIIRRFRDMPVGFAFARLREGGDTLSELTSLVHPRRITRSEERADAEQNAFEALTSAFQTASTAARAGQSFASLSLPSPFGKLGLPSEPGWETAAGAFLDEEIEWELADYLPGLDGTLDRGTQPRRGPWVVRNAEHEAWRRARALMRGGAVDHVELDEDSATDPTPSQNEKWARAFLATVRNRYGSRKAYRAFRALILNDFTKEQAAKVGKVDHKTLDAFIDQVRREFREVPPEK